MSKCKFNVKNSSLKCWLCFRLLFVVVTFAYNYHLYLTLMIKNQYLKLNTTIPQNNYFARNSDTTIPRHLIAFICQDLTSTPHQSGILHIVRTPYVQNGRLKLMKSSTNGRGRSFRKFSIKYLFMNYLQSTKVSTENTKKTRKIT